MWHPAILDGRTWSKLEEHVKDGKHQPDDLKHSFYYSKHHFFVKQMTQNTFTAFMATVAEIITYRRLENLILGQFKMREDPAKCALP